MEILTGNWSRRGLEVWVVDGKAPKYSDPDVVWVCLFWSGEFGEDGSVRGRPQTAVGANSLRKGKVG